MTTTSYKLWSWGMSQYAYEIGFITKEALAELKQAKKDNPNINFEELAEKIRQGKLKPL